MARDPVLQDLPYKVETNERGQILLSPHTNQHSFYQGDLERLLREHAPPGTTAPEFAIATPAGVKSPDVVWMSPERREAIVEDGDPTSVAPEICVEVMSASNTDEEMAEKRRLYRDAGAEEVWIVDVEGRIRFFTEHEIDASHLAPGVPAQL